MTAEGATKKTFKKRRGVKTYPPFWALVRQGAAAHKDGNNETVEQLTQIKVDLIRDRNIILQ